MPDFIWIALTGGLLVTLMSTPIGTLMLWRRMAYVGDALAHTSLLGLALGLWLQLPLTISMLLVAIIIALSVSWLNLRPDVSSDTLLAITAHSSLGLGMLFIALLPEARVDLMGYLFGDLFSLTITDLIWLALAAITTISVLTYYWKQWLLNTLNPELAQLAGIHNQRTALLLSVLTAMVIALSIKLVGALLMTALLITPAATARVFSRSPLQMVVIAVGIGWCAVAMGLAFSWFYDTPVAPSIVSCLLVFFLLSRLIKS